MSVHRYCYADQQSALCTQPVVVKGSIYVYIYQHVHTQQYCKYESSE
jgi:hypothetical protein